jgi:hypothetical protein
MDVKIRVCLPRKYGRFMLFIVNNFQMEQMQDMCMGSVGPLERTQGSATRPNSR